MDDDDTRDLTEALERARATEIPPAPRTISDAELIEQGYRAILGALENPAIAADAVVGQLIELYEQSGRPFLAEAGYDVGAPEAPKTRTGLRRPRLTVIESGTD